MIKKIGLTLLVLLFRIFPRNKHVWVTGKTSSWEYRNAPPAFFDNSKYFFLYLVNNTDERAYWLSSSEQEIKMLKRMQLPVIKYPSVKGVLLVLRAKFSFHHYGPNQINDILQRGSVQLDFWHGTPLKKIRYDVVEKPVEKHTLIHDLMNRGGVEYVSSTSRFLSQKILARAFAIDQDKLLNFGYPRTDILGEEEKNVYAFCEKYSPELLQYIDIASNYKRVLIYMPTYRDDDPAYFEKTKTCFEELSKELERIDGVFFFKLHPLTKYSEIKKYKNIIQIRNDVDIYPFLPFTTHLVTDYSSIFFDYLLLDREIMFIPYDYENYVCHRELYFDYNEITPGAKYYSFDEFVLKLHDIDKLNYKAERNRIASLLIEDYHFDACNNIYKFIKERYL